MKVYGINKKAQLGRYVDLCNGRRVYEWGGKDEKRAQRKRARRYAQNQCDRVGNNDEKTLPHW